jgi:hypothetical protein
MPPWEGVGGRWGFSNITHLMKTVASKMNNVTSEMKIATPMAEPLFAGSNVTYLPKQKRAPLAVRM